MLVISIKIFFFVPTDTFAGPIPKEVATLKDLERLDLSNNQLTGERPHQMKGIPLCEMLSIPLNVPNIKYTGKHRRRSLFASPE